MRDIRRLDPGNSHDGPLLGGWYLLVPIVALAFVRGFWAPDEPRYAQIAKEAFETQSFLVLHLCGDLYPDKPPLVYWLAGLLGQLSGWSEFWMRVPSILATIGSAWLCARIARRWLGERAAAWSVAFYLGSLMVLEIGGRLQLDPVLSFFCLAAVALLIDDSGGASAITRRTLLAGLCAGLAALAKGPPAWVSVGFAIVAFALLPRALRFAPRRSLVAWTGLVVLALLPVATWALFAIRAEPALEEPLLYGQHVGRIAKGVQHRGPVWDHLVGMPLLFLPWTFLFVAGAITSWRSFRARTNAGLVRIAAWFVLVFVFFSIIPPKRDLYLLPIYPAAALIAAFAFDAALREGRLARWIGVSSAGLIVCAGLFLACTPLLVARFDVQALRALDDVGDVAGFARLLVLPGCVLAAGGVVAFVALARSRPNLWADALGAGLALALTVSAFGIVPAVDEQKSARNLAELAAQRPERPSVLACAGVRPEGVRFYGGGPARAISIEKALAQEGASFLALCSEKEFARLAPVVRAEVREVGRARVGRTVVLVLVRAAP